MEKVNSGNITLSSGSLDIILEQRNENLKPVIQILGGKVLNINDRIRVVIFDGKTLCQHCILISEDLKDKYNRGLLSKFTVVRIDKYVISSLPKKDNISVLLIDQLTILKDGNELGKKLDANESFELNLSDDPKENIFHDSQMDLEMKSQTQPKPNIDIKIENICPINVLTPFYNAWTVKALVINKGQIRPYSTKKGDGKVFNFDICDDSGEIRVTCFNDECDRFFDLIQKDKTYYIGKGTIKMANKKFSTIANDYEITLKSSSFIKPCNEIVTPKMRYKFITISAIANLEAGTAIDLIGIIRAVGEIETFVSKKTSTEILKRDINIVDKSLTEVRLTLWNDQATNFKGKPNQVIALKGVLIGDFKGKTLSGKDSTLIDIEPDLPETNLLQTWYKTLEANENFEPLSKSDSNSLFKTNRYFCQINPRKISPGMILNFTCSGTIQSFNRIQNHMYKSCGYNNCQKKLQEDQNGLYYCSKCNRQSQEFTWRIMMNILLTDVSGTIWVTAFQEIVEKMLNKSVIELANIFESNQNHYAAIINELRFKTFNFRIYSRLDSYNNEMRLRHTLSQVYPIQSVDRSQRLMQCIDILYNQISI